MKEMVRTIIITLDATIPDTAIGKATTVTIETNVYTGKVVGIVVHEKDPDATFVTLEAKGLKVKPSPSPQPI